MTYNYRMKKLPGISIEKKNHYVADDETTSLSACSNYHMESEGEHDEKKLLPALSENALTKNCPSHLARCQLYHI